MLGYAKDSGYFLINNGDQQAIIYQSSVNGNISTGWLLEVKEIIRVQYISRSLSVTILRDKNAEKLQRLHFSHLLIENKEQSDVGSLVNFAVKNLQAFQTRCYFQYGQNSFTTLVGSVEVLMSK